MSDQTILFTGAHSSHPSFVFMAYDKTEMNFNKNENALRESGATEDKEEYRDQPKGLVVGKSMEAHQTQGPLRFEGTNSNNVRTVMGNTVNSNPLSVDVEA